MVRGTGRCRTHRQDRARRVFATATKAEEARAAGADVVGGDELIEQVNAACSTFDAAVATRT